MPPTTAVSRPRVGVVILNWRRPDHTMACLDSLVRLRYPTFEVVVVDNGSPEGTPKAIERRFPWITLIENGRNLGFAAGNNEGIDVLMARGAGYVLLLNDDTEVASDLLEALVAAGEADPAIGILGPTVYYHEPASVIWSAGGTVDRLGEAHHLQLGQGGGVVGEGVREVDYVTGCAMLVKRSVVESVGSLDGRFFAYFEDTEWCARARKAGFGVVHVPRAQVWHKIAAPERAGSPYYAYLMARNRLLFLRCSGAGPRARLHAAIELLRTAGSWTVRSENRGKRSLVPALLRGVGDYARGRFGPPPAGLLGVG
ncbi:MAG: glycosyltransferase family 2 protein [Chloroflexota bacterium]